MLRLIGNRCRAEEDWREQPDHLWCSSHGSVLTVGLGRVRLTAPSEFLSEWLSPGLLKEPRPRLVEAHHEEPPGSLAPDAHRKLVAPWSNSSTEPDFG